MKRNSNSHNNPFAGGRHRLAFDLMESKIGMKILDVGCGKGGFLSSLRRSKNQLYGIDPDEESITQLHSSYPDIRTIVASGEELPLASSTFDLIFALDVIEHTNNDQRIINEIFRVLKYNGVLILSVPYQNPFAFLDIVNFKFHFPNLHRLAYRLSGKTDIYRTKFTQGHLYGNFSINPNQSNRHKHYSLKRIYSLLGLHFQIERIHRRGSPITLLCLIANSLYSMFLNKNSGLLFRLWFWDYSIEYGFLGESLMVKAKKC